MENLSGSCGGNAWAVAVQEYLDLYSTMRHADNTKRKTEHILKTFTKWIGFREPKVEDVERYMAERVKAGASPATANLDMRVIKACARWALERDKIKQNPTKGLKQYRHYPLERKRFMPLEDVKKLIAWMDAEGWQDFSDLIRIISSCGLRVCEALYLRAEDVDPFNRSITITPREGWTTKDREKRTIPLDSVSYEVLTRRVAKRKVGLIWPSKKGTPLGYRNCFRKLAAAASGAGLEWANFKSLRSLFATVAAETLTPAQLGKLLGHQSTYVQDRWYVHQRHINVPTVSVLG